MGQPAAKKGDQVMATDTHIVMMPSPSGSVPTPLPHPFSGKLDGDLSSDVKIAGKAAAVKGSTASNSPAHVAQGPSFQSPPADKATVQLGSATVKINGKAAARDGDKAMTCNDPSDLPVGTVMATGTVKIGG